MITQRHRSAIAQLVLVALVLGGLPMAATPVLIVHESAPAITLDLCHPQPAFAINAASCALACAAAFSFSIAVTNHRLNGTSVAGAIGRAAEAPDPPPPKALI